MDKEQQIHQHNTQRLKETLRAQLSNVWEGGAWHKDSPPISVMLLPPPVPELSIAQYISFDGVFL